MIDTDELPPGHTAPDLARPSTLTISRRQLLVSAAVVGGTAALTMGASRPPEPRPTPAPAGQLLPLGQLLAAVPIGIDTARYASPFESADRGASLLAGLGVRRVTDRLAPGVFNQQEALTRLADSDLEMIAIAAVQGDSDQDIHRRLALAAQHQHLITELACVGSAPELERNLQLATRIHPGTERLAVSAALDNRPVLDAAAQALSTRPTAPEAAAVAVRGWLTLASQATPRSHGVWPLATGPTALVHSQHGEWRPTPLYRGVQNLVAVLDQLGQGAAAPGAAPIGGALRATPGLRTQGFALPSGGLLIAAWRPLPMPPGRAPATSRLRMTLPQRCPVSVFVPSRGAHPVRTFVDRECDLSVRDEPVLCVIGPVAQAS